MIVGVGVDLIELERMNHAVHRFGERFLRRIFTDEELFYCEGKRDAVPHLAVRFAAKEAAFKAIRKQQGDGIAWQDVWLASDSGIPNLQWSPRFARRLREIGGGEGWVSVSHSRQFAVAHVVIVSAHRDPKPAASPSR